jgi:hypothetical protein
VRRLFLFVLRSREKQRSRVRKRLTAGGRWIRKTSPEENRTFGRSPGGRAANRDVHPWFASDSPLEEAVSSEPVSEKENSERRQIGRFYEDWERFLDAAERLFPAANPKMVAFLPIVAGPGSAH